MNIVFISDCVPFNVYLLRTLQQHRPIGAILRIARSEEPAKTRLKRIRRAPLGTLSHFAERRLFYNRIGRRLERQGSCHLFDSEVPPPLDNCKIVDVLSRDVNAPATAELLRSLAPDVLVTSWAPLLKPAIYQTARLASLNVHWGIAPGLRGQDSTFWAMYLGDYPNLGVTLHYLDEGIDTGPVLAHGFPAIDQRESEASLLAKSARIAAELLLEFFDAAQRKPSGQSLPGPGRLFNARDRHVWHDARLWYRQNVLRRPLPTRPCSKKVYF
jgi:hypothetical protein